MKRVTQVATPPSKPLLIFDGDCNFCRLWIERWRQMTGDRVEYLPSQDAHVAEQFPELSREQLDAAVHLIATDGAVCAGAEAVFRSLACQPRWRFLLRWYRTSPHFAKCAEAAYRLIAARRSR